MEKHLAINRTVGLSWKGENAPLMERGEKETPTLGSIQWRQIPLKPFSFENQKGQISSVPTAGRLKTWNLKKKKK